MMNVIVLVAVVVGVVRAQITDDGTCGQVNVGSRIINGEPVGRCQWPYVSLVRLKIFWDPQMGQNFGNRTICGGSLITNEYILTTAACAMPFYFNTFIRANTRVLVGDYNETNFDIGNDGTAEDIIPIADVWIHPQYSPDTTGNNIALIRLSRRVVINNCKRPACLETQKEAQTNRCTGPPQVDDTCEMAAVGVTSENTTVPNPDNIPQKAKIKMFNRHVSGAIIDLHPRNRLPDGAVIGRAVDPSVKVCLYDWGGIVVCRKNGLLTLRGIISTSACLVSNSQNLRDSPVFITEISNYRDWIEKCKSGFCPRY